MEMQFQKEHDDGEGFLRFLVGPAPPKPKEDDEDEDESMAAHKDPADEDPVD